MNKITVACVGAGYWGKNLVRNFHAIPGSFLSVCCDLDEDALSFISTHYSDVTITRHFAAVLEDPNVEAVVLATPATSHFRMAKQALEAGKHVFVEKPLALQVGEAEVLCRVAEMQGRVLMVGHLLEYHPAVCKLKEIVDGGDLGDIHYIYTRRLNFGIIRKDETALWSLGPHDVSMVCYLLNKEPHSVNARGVSCVQKGIEDVVFCNLNFSDRVTAQIHVSWLDPHKVRSITIVGSHRMAVFDDRKPLDPIKIYDNYASCAKEPVCNEMAPPRRGIVETVSVNGDEPLRLECEHFLECVRRGQTPRSDGRDGLRVVRILNAAQCSLERDGRPIKLNGPIT